jgi:3-phenylpropionate/cinnamic acid dioxygenase small subunit
MSTASSTMTEAERHVAAQTAFARYAAALDDHDLAALEALHDAAATWTFTTAGQPAVALIEGRGAILDFVAGAPHGPDERQRHVVTNIDIVQGGGDEVDATGYLMLLSAVAGAVTVVATGAIRMRLARGADRWRILTLAVEFDSAPAA